MGRAFALGAFLALGAGPAAGAGEDAPDADAINKALMNPLGNLWMLYTENDTTTYRGFPSSGSQTFNTTIVQPVLAIPLTEDWNVITRPIIPLMVSPVPELSGKYGEFPGEANSGNGLLPFDGTSRHFNLGDITLFGAVTPAEPTPLGDGKLVWGLGPSFIFPTATSNGSRRPVYGSEKWSAGPVAVLTYLGPKWTVGSLVQQWWSYGGTSRRADVNKMSWQYFVWYNLPKQWAIGMMPVISANWEADSKWTVPVGLGVSKVQIFGGKLPIKFIVEVDYSAIHPSDIGSRWNIRLAIVPVIPRMIKNPLF